MQNLQGTVGSKPQLIGSLFQRFLAVGLGKGRAWGCLHSKAVDLHRAIYSWLNRDQLRPLSQAASFAKPGQKPLLQKLLLKQYLGWLLRFLVLAEPESCETAPFDGTGLAFCGDIGHSGFIAHPWVPDCLQGGAAEYQSLSLHML